MAITQKIVKELLHYDPLTGDLTWKERDASWFASERRGVHWNTRFANKAAGYVDTNSRGYKNRVVTVLGDDYYAHQLAWVYMRGLPIPPEIDHLDRDATNNAWDNIEASSRKKNMLNKSRYRNNKSGRTGVSWVNRDKKWCAHISINGNFRSLGYYGTIIEAVAVRMSAEKEAGFSTNHGMPAPYRETVP